jgi:hypothetical protein
VVYIILLCPLGVLFVDSAYVFCMGAVVKFLVFVCRGMLKECCFPTQLPGTEMSTAFSCRVSDSCRIVAVVHGCIILDQFCLLQI